MSLTYKVILQTSVSKALPSNCCVKMVIICCCQHRVLFCSSGFSGTLDPPASTPHVVECQVMPDSKKKANLFKSILSFNVFGCFAFMCVWTWCPQMPEVEITVPRTRITDGSELPRGNWESNMGPLEDLKSLTTESSLQDLKKRIFYFLQILK